MLFRLDICSPLEQFNIFNLVLFRYVSLISNATYTIFFTYTLLAYFFYKCNKVTNIGFIQFILQQLFFLVSSVAKSNIKIKKQIYVLQLFIIFLFILISNLLGLVPYGFSLTSHFCVTLFLSYSFFISMIIIGIKKNGVRVYKLFIPSRVPLFIIPVLACVELLSFFIRPLSLAIRLSANMLSGHVLLKILALVS